MNKEHPARSGKSHAKFFSSPGTLAFLLLLDACLLFVLLRTWYAPKDPAVFLLVSVMALVAELTRVPLSLAGSFNFAFPAYFALGICNNYGPGSAAGLILVGKVTKVLTPSSQSAPARLAESVAEAGSILAGIELAALVGGPSVFPSGRWLIAAMLGASSWLILDTLFLSVVNSYADVERQQMWGRTLMSLQGLKVGASCCGLLLGAILPSLPWLSALLLPFLWGIRPIAQIMVHALSHKDPAHLEQEVARLSRELETARSQQIETSTYLQRKIDEASLLQELHAALEEPLDAKGILERLFDLAGRMVRFESCSFFQPAEGKLLPFSWISVHGDRLSNAKLLDLVEPSVEKAYLDKKPYLVLEQRDTGQRLFPGEKSCLAIPEIIHGEVLGVFYFGAKERRSFRQREVTLLRSLTRAVGASLRYALVLGEREEQLVEVKVAKEDLDSRLRQLSIVLECAQALGATLDEGGVLDTLMERLRSIIPAESSFLALLSRDNPYEASVCREVTVSRARGRVSHLQGRKVPVLNVLDDLLATPLFQGITLLLENISKTRFEHLVEEEMSVLLLPFVSEREVHGAIYLGSSKPHAFVREHQDLALTMAYTAGTAWMNARRYREVVETHRRLAESQAQLVQSSKMAAVGQLAAGVAHELNTPLATILINIQGTLSFAEKTDEKIARKLRVAEKASMRAKGIIEKLLSYTREGKAAQAVFDLNSIVDDTLILVGHQLEVENIELVKDLSPNMPVAGNFQEISQVLTNLVLNSRDAIKEKFSGKQGGRIIIRTKMDGADAVMEVEDNGPGIPPEVRERIFEPFFTTKEVGKGTGLGLSITMQLVEKHEGKVTLSSSPEGGAVFSVHLPLAEEEKA